MFFKFVGALFVLGWAFRLLLMLFGIPLGLFMNLANRWDDAGTRSWSIVLNLVVQSVIYSGFIAIVAVAYGTASPPSWPYAVTGFVTVYMVLGSMAFSRRQELADTFLAIPDEDDRAALDGASLGVVVALVTYPAFYIWPTLLLFIPGAATFLEWTIGTADWLLGFGLVQLIVGFAILGFVFQAGFMALFGVFMIIGAAMAGLRLLLGTAEDASS